MSFGIVVALLAMLSLALPAFASASPLGSLSLFKSGLRGSAFIKSLTPGPDGNVWFVDNWEFSEFPAIGRITPGGEIIEYEPEELTGLNEGADLVAITAAPKGEKYLWVTDKSEAIPALGVIGTASPKAVTEFSVAAKGGNGGSVPQGIAVGSDGNLWFADTGETSAIAKVELSSPTEVKKITECSAGLNEGSEPRGIVAGPDGNLWFTDVGTTKAVGKVNPSTCEITEYATGEGSIPGGTNSMIGPWGIAAGPDGNVWYTDGGASKAVCRITPSGTITCFNSGLVSSSKPLGLTAAPDGNLWFTDNSLVNEVQELEIKATESLGGTYKLAYEGKETGASCTGDLTSGSKEVKNVSCTGLVIRGEMYNEGAEGIPAPNFVEKCNNGNTCGSTGASVTKVFLTTAATITKAGVPFTTNLSVKSNALNTNTTIKQALEVLPGIGTGNVSVSGSGFTSPIKRTIEFTGELQGNDVALTTCNGAGLTGTSPSCSIATTKTAVPNAIGSITTSGTIARYPDAGLRWGSSGITSNGSEGNVWLSTGFTIHQQFGRFGIEPSLKVKVTCTGTGSGTVSPVGCGSSAEYESGKEVEFTATPGEKSEFMGWTKGSGTCTGKTTPCKVTISGFNDIELEAEFKKEGTPPPTNLKTLTVTKSPSSSTGGGNGSVSSKPKGVKCGATCDEAVARMYKESSVELKAKASTGSTLVSWTGCDSSTNTGLEGTCTVKMTGDKEVKVTFGGTSKAFTPAEELTVSKGKSEENRGKGTVKAAGLGCEADCQETTVLYQGPVTEPKAKAGKTVILKQSPAFGSKFTGWTGCDSVTEAGECVVEMDEDHTVKAEYTALPNKVLTVNKSYAKGNGSVASKPKGIKCATTCTQAVASMPEGAAIELVAKPTTGTFEEWVGGDCNGSKSATCVVTMNTDETTKAVFSDPGKAIAEAKTLTVDKEGSGLGTVKAAGLTCEVLCSSTSALYTGPVTLPKAKPGKVVTLKATSAPGSETVAWTGCDSNPTPGECVVEMDEDHAVSAKFDELK